MMMINIAGLLLIALIIWWFWLYKSDEVLASDTEISIIIENGTYQPSRIKVPADTEIKIYFIRKDVSPCSATVLIPDFEIAEELALNKTTVVSLPPLEVGEYPFHCQMQMYKGTLLVE